MRHFLFFVLCFSFSCVVWGADQSSPTPITDQAAQIQTTPIIDGNQYNMKHFLPNAERNFVHIFSKSNYGAFLFTAIGTGISSTADDEVHDYFKDRHPDGSPQNIFNMIGKPYVLGPAVGSLLLLGQHSENHRFHDFSYALAQAYVLNYGIITSMKFAVGRERPDFTSNQSFPSGHAADGFMIAAVLHNFYGNKAGVFGYSFATLMAVSRLKKDRHWVSDVVAGSAIGYIVGTSVCNHMTITHNQLQMTMLPLVEPFEHRLGLNVYARF